jgi:hypothetical protein
MSGASAAAAAPDMSLLAAAAVPAGAASEVFLLLLCCCASSKQLAMYLHIRELPPVSPPAASMHITYMLQHLHSSTVACCKQARGPCPIYRQTYCNEAFTHVVPATAVSATLRSPVSCWDTEMCEPSPAAAASSGSAELRLSSRATACSMPGMHLCTADMDQETAQAPIRVLQFQAVQHHALLLHCLPI